MTVIEARNLKKSYRNAVKKSGLGGALKHLFMPVYKEVTAVDHINLKILEGEAVAYVGPNGAGKSTTIKMLTGILFPTSGKVDILGIDPYRERIKNTKNIGVVFGQRTQLWWDIPIVESFTLLRDIYGLSEPQYRENLKYLTELLDLKPLLSLSARKLSLGQRMRADIAASLIHDPKIIYLDEPTIGLDISVRERIREFLTTVNRQKKTTILLTSHDLDDIKDVCKRLIIIDNGTIVYDGTLDDVAGRFLKDRTIHFTLSSVPADIENIIGKIKGIELAGIDGKTCSVRFNRFHHTASDMVGKLMKSLEMLDFQIEEPDIEQVIKAVYERKLDMTGVPQTASL